MPDLSYHTARWCISNERVQAGLENEDDACMYGWEAAMGSPTEMGKVCPECGEPTAVMSYAT